LIGQVDVSREMAGTDKRFATAIERLAGGITLQKAEWTDREAA
jgi:menaquinone-dependent protoporphyrinogen IX oxidase